MRRYIYIIILVVLCVSLPVLSQTKKQSTAKTAVSKSANGKKGGVVKTKTTKNPSKTTTKGAKKTSKKNTKKSNRKSSSKTPKYETTEEIKNLQSESKKIKNEISAKEKELKAKENDVRQRLSQLVIINTEIENKQKSIDTIQSDIKVLDGNIDVLKAQLSTLENQLGERKEKFIASMRYMSRHRSIQDKLMFIFSADNLSQMYRRLRFVREYAAYQRAQGQLLLDKKRQVASKQSQLNSVRKDKSNLLYKGKRTHAELQGKQAEQQKVVESLQAENATLQGVISEQKKKQAALDAKIDGLIALEIKKARERAAAEEKARAAAQAAERKRKAEEAARKKAAAEAAARENARKIAEAKAREAKAKEEARAAAEAAEKARQQAIAEKEKKDRLAAEKAAAAAAERKHKAEQLAKEAESDRMAAEKKAEIENKRAKADADKASRDAELSAESLSSEDRMLSGSFANHKGRLPMPMSGKIIGHYGQYNVEGLKNVKLSNNGITIKGSSGAAVRSIYSGEVSAVFGFSGTMVVMVRHGAYISVYCNLSSVSVSKGQKVSAQQSLGTVGSDGIMQFQLRKETAKLNPESWLR